MTPERVLQRPSLVLDQRARERYFEDGFLTLPGYVAAAWLERLRAVVAAKIEASRLLTASDDQFDLAPDHSAEKPNIRRLRKAVDQHPELWSFAQDRSVVDLLADLLGPDIRFHSSKLNFKWSDGGEAVRWHQDIQAWPHTNFAVLTFGVYLEDTGPEQGPLTALPGTHRGSIFDQFDDDGRWTGALTPRDVATLPTDKAVDLYGPAGTVVLLHCRVVHGSAINHSPRMRPLFLNVYAAADALPITPAPAPTSRTGVLVRGREPRHVHMEHYPARLPPRWDQVGYRSIFSAQAAAAGPRTPTRT
jgi:ectoine hydroxylase